MKLPEWMTGLERRRLRDAERQRILGVGMHDGMDIGPRLEDRRVDEALEIERAALVAHRPAVEPEFDDVVRLDQFGRHANATGRSASDCPDCGR